MSELIDRQKAIDAILHITNCKSVRELFEYNQEHHLTEMWSGGVNDAIDAVIGVESATDNNVGTELGTNLASLGTDCSEFPNNSDAISRQAALNEFCHSCDEWHCNPNTCCKTEWIRKLPPIQPEIVRCEDCKYAEYINDVQTLWCTECGQGRTVAPNDFCSYAERREVTDS